MPRKHSLPARDCAQCGDSFSPTRNPRQRFCSNRCSGLGRGGGQLARFMALVSPQPNGCWLWAGKGWTIGNGPEYGGYPRVSWDSRLILAHHASYRIHVGPIPEGKILRHRCPGGGNAWCVNPEHLEPGTRRQNYQDMLDDGRHWSQSGSWSPKRRRTALTGETRELVVILPRKVHRALAAKAKAGGLSLQEAAVLALTMAARE